MQTLEHGAQSPELFYGSLIESYVANRRFIQRNWLESAIQERLVDNPDRQFFLITAEPGAGKTAALAWLARQHPQWPRYFIRRNEVSPLGPPGARSFLFQVGLQLAAVFPAAFGTKRLNITVEQRLRRVTGDVSVIGAEIKRLIASPFITAAIRITQEVEAASGSIAGLKVDEYVAEPRMSSVSDLQYLALIDPASAILNDTPDQLVVILVDAIDELRYQPQEDSLLNWLENCPDLPENVRVVIASRPDDDLLRSFRDRQSKRIQEFPLDIHSDELRGHILFDLRRYAHNLVAIPEVAAKLRDIALSGDEFVSDVVQRAEGNLGYLDAIRRAADQFISQKDDASLVGLLLLKDLPPGLRQLYAYFLHIVKRRAVDRSVAIIDTSRGTVDRASAWSEVHSPVLGILSVAAEPLKPSQIHRLALIQASDDELNLALDDLRQFLDESKGAYRLYHSTMPEFLGDPSTRDNRDIRDLYQDPVAWNGRVASFYAMSTGGWQQANWSALDSYGWRHLAGHLVAGGDALRPQLYELYSAGFLAAKRAVSASAAELEPDWRLILQACSEAQDLLAFLRFGYQISQQSTELSYLQLGDAAATAVNFALRRKDRLAVERIAAELALIEYPFARVSGQQMLLEQVLDDRDFADISAQLMANIDALLPALDPGPDRDAALARQIGILAKAGRPGWEHEASEALPTISTLHCRTQIYAALSDSAARSGQIKAAADRFMSAIEECRRFDVKDNVVGDVLQLVLHVERVEPSAELGAAIDHLLPAIAAFGPAADEPTVRSLADAVREQFARLRRPDMRLQLEAKLFNLLGDGGHRDLAVAIASPIVEEQIRESAVPTTPAPDPRDFGNSMVESGRASGVVINLLPLLSAAAAVNNGARLAEIEQRILGHVNRISRTESLMNAAQYASAVPPFEPEVRRVALSILHAIEMRARKVTGKEGLFVILSLLSPGYVRAGHSHHATENIQSILKRVPSVWPAPATYPEQAQALLAGFQTMWAAACMIGDEPLLNSVLDWLTSAVPSSVGYSNAGDIWINATGILQQIPDLKVGERMLNRLRPRLLETRDVERFEATATIQMADAYAELGMKQESLRLLNSPPVRSVFRWPPLAGWVASVRATQGDLAGSRKVLERTLETIPSAPGLNVQADTLIALKKGFQALASSGPKGARRAKTLSRKSLAIGRKIDGGEYSILSLAAIAEALLAGGLPAPTRELADFARRYLKTGKPLGRVKAVLRPIAVLHQAARTAQQKTAWSKWMQLFQEPENPAEAERELLLEVEAALVAAQPESDLDRAQFCAVCAQVAGLYQFMGDTESDPKWRDLAAACARAIVGARERVDACCEMANIDAIYRRPGDAVHWIESAITAYPAIKEVYEINSAAERIVDAWESLPEPALRSGCAERVNRVQWRLNNPGLRMQLQARMAIGLWHDRDRFLEILSRLPPGSSSDLILRAIREKDTVPAGIGPPVLFRCLEKAARQSRVGFAGESLTAIQASVRRAWFDRPILLSALQGIESMMREISPTGLGTSRN